MEFGSRSLCALDWLNLFYGRCQHGHWAFSGDLPDGHSSLESGQRRYGGGGAGHFVCRRAGAGGLAGGLVSA